MNLFCYVVPSGLYMQLVASHSAIFQLCSDGAYIKILTDQTPTPLAAKNAVSPHGSRPKDAL